MASLEELRAERLKKLERIRREGMVAYPSFSLREHKGEPIEAILKTFEERLAAKAETRFAGRIMAMRGQGALLFLDVFDGTGKLQVLFRKDVLPPERFTLAREVLDRGDFIFVSGTPMVTKRGERSIEAGDWRVLVKSVAPLPDKWHGIADEELRYRKRYLDMLLNDELRDMVFKKALFWRVARTYMEEHGFVSVETPMLETTTGGAEARPFKTHHYDLDIDVYLRISVGELWQKRLLVGGIPKTYEIGRVFRNEGTGPHHVQEFTNLEFYWAYANYRDGMKFVQELYRRIAREVFGTTSFMTGEYSYDLADEWKTISYVEEVRRQTGINVLQDSEDDMRNYLTEHRVVYEGANRERLVDTLWKHCRKNLSGPLFVVDHPKIVSPLAKTKDENPECTERFQVIIAGSEVGNGYTELNDPIEQRERFSVQQSLREAGDVEAMMPDDDFVEALEHGMPPACGFGFGDRLFAFLVNKPVRETQLFPLLRPRR